MPRITEVCKSIHTSILCLVLIHSFVSALLCSDWHINLTYKCILALTWLSFSSVLYSISEEIINSALKKVTPAILWLVWRHKMTCCFTPVLFYLFLLQIFLSRVTWPRVIWWIITEVLEVPAASIFKYNCDSNTFHWFISTYLPLHGVTCKNTYGYSNRRWYQTTKIHSCAGCF